MNVVDAADADAADAAAALCVRHRTDRPLTPAYA